MSSLDLDTVSGGQAQRPPRRPVSVDGGPSASGRDSLAELALGPLREAGRMGSFAISALLSLRGVWQFAAEILRQCGILIVGSAFVIWAMEFVIGGECALFGTYLLRTFAASGAIGFFTEICDPRVLFPLMFGYIFAAKVGCGLVAEIGSMRISDEISALESMGVDSMRYVVGTRLMAAILAMPLIYIIGVMVGTGGSFVTVVWQIREISMGGWSALHWGYQSLGDNLIGFVQAMSVGVAIVLVATFYGFRTRGGPVEVGAATARSMIVNLVLVHLIILAISTAYWGGADARLPIGG
jgi:phospholipid/cholesterol/gamma-HCH transport system permease protein